MHMSSVFFFKQKTAYEMRISDWSSDVCSSDLPESGEVEFDQGTISDVLPNRRKIGGIEQAHTDGVETGQQRLTLSLPTFQGRSEEHTSELQSLMRISSAVFCLKKKTNNNYIQHNILNTA